MESTPSSVADREMPADVAERFEIALGLAETPRTLGDWLEATVTRLSAAGVTLGVDQLCLTDASPHRAEIDGETRYFACVLDTLVLPFVLDEPGPVAVRTRSPVTGDPIDVDVTRQGVAAPADAVMSFGVAADVPPPDERDGVLAFGTAVFCPYINAFATEREYEAWAAETPEAVTMALPLAEGFALAERLARHLTAE